MKYLDRGHKLSSILTVYRESVAWVQILNIIAVEGVKYLFISIDNLFRTVILIDPSLIN